ncbi:hypothetical protein F8568_024180 [Actinomadura sp. LD22]|uniref:Uncharacterized protein n=1 Tax=Actinomadura physcomitrii TaxID=2650748 RepID=A0A6I4MEW1_9ACTN|nr:pyridoxamine 5'-phosphate oxidase family protein [Actinomadura physcomitrii]MWA03420.1 hypothetical protein [Actinomadura physcomitrii]
MIADESRGLRPLDRTACLWRLTHAVIGRVAWAGCAGRAVLVPVNFVVDGPGVTFLTAAGGHLSEAVRARNRLTRPPTVRTGTPRRSVPGAPSTPSNRASSTSTASPPATDSSGSAPPRSRFHLPTPASPYRNPSEPFGTSGCPVAASRITVLNAACSDTASAPGRSAAVRNLPGTWRPSRSSRRTRNGRSL